VHHYEMTSCKGKKVLPLDGECQEFAVK